YYPEIAIPSGNWLRQAVLYFDEVGSIVPEPIEFVTMKQALKKPKNSQGKQLWIESEDISILKGAGQYRPFHPESLVESYGVERDDFNNDFLAALVSEPFQRTLGKRAGWIYDAEIHVRKGVPKLFELLIAEGYAK